MNTLDSIWIIAVTAGVTFLLRFLPFALFGKQDRPSLLLADLSLLLPSAIIAVLVIYCLKTIDFRQAGSFIPQLAAVAVVAALHIWKRNNLLSIGVGTACYMVLVQVVFI